MTILIRKYYNQPVAFDHRRIWLQKENQKRELREDLQNPNQGLGKKKPFGGYAISFSGRTETVEQVFGKGAITPSEMTKKIWKFVKAKRLSNR